MSWTCSSSSRACCMKVTTPVAVGPAQRRRPALVLLEQPGEALPSGVGEPEQLAPAVGDRDLLELVAQEHVFEVGLTLQVAMVASAGEAIQRRLGDVHVAGLDQRLHLAK